MTIKRKILAAILALALPLASPVLASEQAVTFVQNNVSKVLQVLSDPALGDVQKGKLFSEVITQVTDVDVIARFVLGQYAATASTPEFERFARVFRGYALGVYQSELSRFGNEVLEVQSVQERKPGDSVVLTRISGGALSKKSRDVKWRVITIKGTPRVVDIEISGVWLSQHQRAEITGIITKNGGQISAATKMLCSQSKTCTVTG